MAEENTAPEAEGLEAAEATPGPAADPRESAEGAAPIGEAGPAAEKPATKPAKPKRASKPKTEAPKAAAKPKPRSRAGAKRSRAERKAIVRVPRPVRERGKQKERRGVVVSSAMDKTIVVRVDTVRPHRAYKKVVRRSTKFHAHDEQNAANVGDVVRIVESRRISKTKVWRLAEILEVAR